MNNFKKTLLLKSNKLKRYMNKSSGGWFLWWRPEDHTSVVIKATAVSTVRFIMYVPSGGTEIAVDVLVYQSTITGL